jgi:hypothetical protein
METFVKITISGGENYQNRGGGTDEKRNILNVPGYKHFD